MAVNPKKNVENEKSIVAVGGRNAFQLFELVSKESSVDVSSFIGRNSMKFQEKCFVSLYGTKKLDSRAGDVQNSFSDTATTDSRGFSLTTMVWTMSGDYIVTGSASGDITFWNVEIGTYLNHVRTVSCFPGHNRTIHRVALQNESHAEVTSASQDGTIKIFDLREGNKNIKCLSQKTAALSPVRDIAYCPGRSEMLVAAQENGIIMLWDTRFESRPYSSFTGHLCSIPSLNWHPEFNMSSRNWLATGGSRDRLIKIWDFSIFNSESQNFPSHKGIVSGASQNLVPTLIHTIRTSRVNRVRWQPGAGNELHIVSSGNLPIDLNIYLWHLERPFMPFSTIDGHSDVVQSLIWDPNDKNCLYSVSKEGSLIHQNVVSNSFHLLDYAPKSAISINTYGQIAHGYVSNHYNGGSFTLQGSIFENSRKQSRTKLTSENKTSSKEKSPRRETIEMDSQEALLPSPTQQQLKNKRSHKRSEQMRSDKIEIEATTVRDRSQQRKLIQDELIDSISREKWKLFLQNKKSDFFTYNIDAATIPFYLKNYSQQMEFYNDMLHITFTHLAIGYKLKGDSLQELCEYNANLCEELNEPVLSQFWQTIRMIFSWPYDSGQGTSQKSSKPVKNKKFNGIPEEFQKNSVLRGVFFKETFAPILQLPELIQSDEQKVSASMDTERDHGKPVARGFHNEKINFTSGVPLDVMVNDFRVKQMNAENSEKVTSRDANNSQDIRTFLKDDNNFEFFGINKPDKFFELIKQEESNHCENKQLYSQGMNLQSFITKELSGTSIIQKDGKMDYNIPKDPYRVRSISSTNQLLYFRKNEISPSEIDRPVISKKERSFSQRQKYHNFPIRSGLSNRYQKKNISVQKQTNKKRSSTRPSASLPLSPFIVATLKSHLNTFLVKKFSRREFLKFEQKPKIFITQNEENLYRIDLINAIKNWMLQLVDFGHVQTVCTALLCLGVRRLRLWDSITEDQVNNWFYTYLDVLERFKLRNTATLIMKKSGSIFGTTDESYYRQPNKSLIDANIVSSDSEVDEDIRRFSASRDVVKTNEIQPLAMKIATINKTGTTFAIRCGRCEKPMQTKPLNNYPTDSSAYPPNETDNEKSDHGNNQSQGWACNNHEGSRPELATCSFCRSTVKGIFITCVICNHGGHLHHILQWWSSDRKYCPAGCGHICEYE